jgi:hypothetical protein
MNATKTKALGLDSITLVIPTGWTDETSQLTARAAVLLSVRAPITYGSDHATFTVVAQGPRRGSSAHEIAIDDATGHTSAGTQSLVNDCTIGGENASFYRLQYPADARLHTRLLILHSPMSKYPMLYLVEISSQGQIGERTAADVRAILGSWTWGAPLYDPNT